MEIGYGQLNPNPRNTELNPMLHDLSVDLQFVWTELQLNIRLLRWGTKDWNQMKKCLILKRATQ